MPQAAETQIPQGFPAFEQGPNVTGDYGKRQAVSRITLKQKSNMGTVF